MVKITLVKYLKSRLPTRVAGAARLLVDLEPTQLSFRQVLCQGLDHLSTLAFPLVVQVKTVFISQHI